jgi:hypothetical protein
MGLHVERIYERCMRWTLLPDPARTPGPVQPKKLGRRGKN